MGWFTRSKPAAAASEDPLNEEYRLLTPDQKPLVDGVIAEARRLNRQVRRASGGLDAYAHPHPGGGIAWGLDGPPRGFNIARGVMAK